MPRRILTRARLRTAARMICVGWSIVGLTGLLVLGADRIAGCRAERNRVRDALSAAHAEAYGDAPWAESWWREFAAFLDTEAGTRWEPFSYWRSREFHGTYVNVDQAGLRVTWQAKHEASVKPQRVLVYGGSTVWGVGDRDDGTISSRLAMYLEESGIPVVVENRAQMGYVNTQEVIALLRALQAGERPDVVVFVDGFNDVLAARTLRRAGVTWNEQKRAGEFNLEARPASLLGALVGSSGFVRLFKDETPAWLIPMPSSEVDRLADEVLAEYAVNTALVDHAQRAFGYHALFYWQPLLIRKARRTKFEAASAEALQNAVPMFDRIARHWPERGLADNPRFHDISSLFADESAALFTDICHYSEDANARIARRIATDVIEVLRESRAPGQASPGAP